MNQRRKPSRLSPLERLSAIARIIEGVDSRCMAADGPVTPTLQEMTQAEINKIYCLARRAAALKKGSGG